MSRSLSPGFFTRGRSTNTSFSHRGPITSINFRSRFHYASRLMNSNESGSTSQTSRCTESAPVCMPSWQKSKVWSKIFNPYYHERYKPYPGSSTPVPLWDIAPGCLLFIPSKERLAPETINEIEKYGHIDMAGHHVLVLAVDIKGPNEGTVGLCTIRSFTGHQNGCPYVGHTWFDSVNFEIEQNGQKDLPPPLEHNIQRVRLYKTPLSNTYNYVRQFVQTDSIFTVSYRELYTESKFLPSSWWPSATLDAWGRRIIKVDFMQICKTIGFEPDPWQSSGPYMWKNFVEKTGINTFGFDIEDPALYDERAFYLQMWEEGRAKYKEFYQKGFYDSSRYFSPLGWKLDQSLGPNIRKCML